MSKLITFFDTETTGLSTDKGHRVIEIALSCYLDGKLQFEFEERFNPGVAIDPKASLVHKISQSDLIGKGKFSEFLPELDEILAETELLVAHNYAFDAEFVANEYMIAKRPIPDVKGYCTMENSRWATSYGKLPSLNELCYACEVDYDPEVAHAALYDTRKLAECFFRSLEHNVFNLEDLL